MQKDYLPREMEVKYSNGSQECRLILKDDTLFKGEESYKPSRGEWEKFWEDLEEIGIWDWEEEYQACSLLEDLNWEITIITNSINLYTRGTNSGPVRMIKGEFVSSLSEFFQALEDLVGWKMDIMSD